MGDGSSLGVSVANEGGLLSTGAVKPPGLRPGLFGMGGSSKWGPLNGCGLPGGAGYVSSCFSVTTMNVNCSSMAVPPGQHMHITQLVDKHGTTHASSQHHVSIAISRLVSLRGNSLNIIDMNGDLNAN